jgi:hypothetical protein
MAFPLLTLSHITPCCAATRLNCNLVAGDCAAVALERIEPDGSPLHQVSTGSSLNMHQAPALQTAPSARQHSTDSSFRTFLSSTLRGSIPRPMTTRSHRNW